MLSQCAGRERLAGRRARYEPSHRALGAVATESGRKATAREWPV